MLLYLVILLAAAAGAVPTWAEPQGLAPAVLGDWVVVVPVVHRGLRQGLVRLELQIVVQGGGGSGGSVPSNVGGSGGSGIVIIRYLV